MCYRRQHDGALDPAIHCTDAAEILSLSWEHEEGEASTIEVERSQRTWLDLIFGGPRELILSESVTGSPADAVVIARARINKLPYQVMSETQTLSAICAPLDIKEKLLAFAKENLVEGTDFRFSDEDPEDPSTYLLTRSAIFHIDPATHEISLSDDLEGATTHVLDDVALIGDEGPVESDGLYGEPVATIRAKLTLGWTEWRRSKIDIASAFNQTGRFTSLDPSVAGRLASSIVSAGSEGWTVLPGGVDVAVQSFTPSGSGNGGTEVGSVYKVRRRELFRDPIEVKDNVGSPLATIPNYIPLYREDGTRSARPVFKNFVYNVRKFLLGYDYEQDRVENLYASLGVPVRQQVVFNDDSETLEFAIDDLFGDPDAVEYKSNESYEEGDEVHYNGRYYRAKEDHYPEFWDELREDDTSYWEPYTPVNDFMANGLTSVLDHARGASIVEHLFARLWTEGRRRSRFRHFAVPIAWEDARAIRLLDSVSLKVPTTPLNPQLFHRITGKVVRISRTWDPDGEQLAIVEFGVSALQTYGSPEDGSIEFGVSGDPVTNSPTFSARSVEISNEAPAQLARVAEVAAMPGMAPEDLSVVYPTTIKIQLRPIAARSTLEREVDASGFFRWSKGGIEQG